MTIKRSDLASWLDKECDKTKAYALSAVVEGMKERKVSILKHPGTSMVWHVFGLDPFECEPVYMNAGLSDLPWSVVRVQHFYFEDGVLILSGTAKSFKGPPEFVTLKVAKKYLDRLTEYEKRCMCDGPVDDFLSNAKEVK